MKCTVRSADLARELALAERVIDRKSMVPICSHAHIKAIDTGLLIEATDLSVAIRTTVGAVVEKLGEATAPVAKLHDLVRSLGNAELDIELHGSVLRLDSASFTAQLQTLVVNDFPTLATRPRMREAYIARTSLHSMIKRVRCAVSQGDVRYFLAGAQLEISASRATLVATDGHRMAIAEAECRGDAIGAGIGGAAAIVPKRALDALSAALEDGPDDISYEVADNHLFFDDGRRLLIVGIVDGTFPDWRKLVPITPVSPLTIARDTMQAAMGRVMMVDSRAVLSLEPGACLLHGRAADIGEVAETVPAEYAGPSLQVGLNGKYVMDFLNVAETELVSLAVRDPVAVVIWQPARQSDEDRVTYTYALMPMRL